VEERAGLALDLHDLGAQTKALEIALWRDRPSSRSKPTRCAVQ
jgi:hypothetical protein